MFVLIGSTFIGIGFFMFLFLLYKTIEAKIRRKSFNVGDVITSEVESKNPFGPSYCWLVLSKEIGGNKFVYYKLVECSQTGVAESGCTFVRCETEMEDMVKIATNVAV